MNLVVVVGAGFSKAVHGAFPNVDELGELVRADVPEALHGAPPAFGRGSFERWLSRIAEPQPDLGEAANLRNAAQFQLVTTAIHERMLAIEAKAVAEQAVPWWLLRFVGVLHKLRATVITFNYDTVVERAASGVVEHEYRQRVSAFNLVDGIPPDASFGMYANPEVETFRLLKLHGSLDTYWVPGDVTGATIVRLPGADHWMSGAVKARASLNVARLVPGRVPFVIPPASAKSAYLTNPITRQLWRTASERLTAATRVAIMGYSVPVTDLVVTAMLGETQRSSGAHVDVINPSPEPVVEALVAGAGIDRSRVRTASESCEGYVDELETVLGVQATDELGTLDAVEAEVLVAGPSIGEARAVTRATLDPATNDLALSVGDVQPFEYPTQSERGLSLAAVLGKCRGQAGWTMSVTLVEGERARIIGHLRRPRNSLAGDAIVLIPSACRFPTA
jgi:hypothetical protein